MNIKELIARSLINKAAAQKTTAAIALQEANGGGKTGGGVSAPSWSESQYTLKKQGGLTAAN
jgi:hypothetical protein